MKSPQQPMKDDDTNAGNRNRVTIEEVDRKVETLGARLAQSNNEARQEFRTLRAAMEGYNTRLWIVLGVIVAVLAWFNYPDGRYAIAGKTISFEEAVTMVENGKKEVTTSPIRAQD